MLDQVHTISTPPTWRAKDVGETDPRTPMGPADRALSVRRAAEIARRADQGEAHEQFTQLRSSPER